MAVRAGWEPEPSFGDALAGDGGMADPAPARWLPSAGDAVFTDALSVAPQRTPGAGGSEPAAMAPAAVASAPAAQAPAVPARPAPSAGPPSRPPGWAPARSAQWAPPRSVRPPPTGRPAGQPVPFAPSARGIAPPPAGYPGYVPVPNPAPVMPAAPFRSPGAAANTTAQVRAAIGQARAAAAARSSLGRSARRTSSALSWLVVLVVLLFATGLGQQIVSAITDLLQRR